MSEPFEHTIESVVEAISALASVARQKMEQRHQLYQEIEDIQCQIGEFNIVANNLAFEERNLPRVDDVVEDELGVQYRVTSAHYIVNGLSSLTDEWAFNKKNKSCGSLPTPPSVDTYRKGRSELRGIRLSKTGIPTHKEPRPLYGSLKRITKVEVE